MKRTLCLLIVLCGFGAAPVKIVGPDAVDPYKLVRLSADGGKDSGYIWDIFPDGMADVDDSAPGSITFVGPPGSYLVKLRIVNFADKSIVTSRKTVVIGTPSPPTPPVPSDPLWLKLKAAYDGATETNKADLSARLYGVYAAAGSKQGLSYDASLTTPDAVHAKLATLIGTKLQPNELQGLRRAIGDELNATLPKTGTLSAADRDTIAFQFNRIAGLLDALTP